MLLYKYKEKHWNVRTCSHFWPTKSYYLGSLWDILQRASHFRWKLLQ